MDGDDLLSHRVAAAVPLAQGGLTSVFGMGTGRALPLTSPSEGVRIGMGSTLYSADVAFQTGITELSWEVKPNGRLVRVS